MTLEEHTKQLQELVSKFNMPLDPRRQAEIYKEFEREKNLKEYPSLTEEFAEMFRLRKFFYFKLEKDFDYAHIYGFINHELGLMEARIQAQLIADQIFKEFQ